MQLFPIITDKWFTHDFMNALTNKRKFGLFFKLLDGFLILENLINTLLVLFCFIHLTTFDALSNILCFTKFQTKIDDLFTNLNSFIIFLYLWFYWYWYTVEQWLNRLIEKSEILVYILHNFNNCVRCKGFDLFLTRFLDKNPKTSNTVTRTPLYKTITNHVSFSHLLKK